jgi:hypothetical protein
MNMRIRPALLAVFAFALAVPFQARAQAPLPAGWPNRLELGMGDSPGGAATMKATAPFAFRYQYLSAGVNTGYGWSTWNPGGDFAKYYIEDSIASGIIPVFTYYNIVQSLPANGNESQVYTNLNTASTMTAYYNDLKLFFQKAGAPAFAGKTVVLHVEPDLWGFMQIRQGTNDNAQNVATVVASSGLAELTGLPNNFSGFARAIVKLRDTYAPNVVLGYHISVWGTGTDIALSNPPDPTIDTLAGRAVAFYQSLAANFDIAFSEFSDRDSAFYQFEYGDNGAHWWDAGDFTRGARFLRGFSTGASKRIVMWQIPLGNTKMRAQNNTRRHYQDNRTEWFLDEAARTHLAEYRDAGVVAFLFAGGASYTTCACDAKLDGSSSGDGVTNPAAINGNNIVSQAGTGAPSLSGTTLTTPYAADDDGGYFRWRAYRYYQDGPIVFGPAQTPPAAPTNLRIIR